MDFFFVFVFGKGHYFVLSFSTQVVLERKSFSIYDAVWSYARAINNTLAKDAGFINRYNFWKQNATAINTLVDEFENLDFQGLTVSPKCVFLTL